MAPFCKLIYETTIVNKKLFLNFAFTWPPKCNGLFFYSVQKFIQFFHNFASKKTDKNTGVKASLSFMLKVISEKIVRFDTLYVVMLCRF